MSARPIDKRSRTPTAEDADHKGRVKVWYDNEWVDVAYDSFKEFPFVQYWLPNKGTPQCQHLHG